MPVIQSLSYSEEKGDYKLSIRNTTVSFLNAVRRSLLNNVSCYAFRSEYPTEMPEKKLYQTIFETGFGIPYGTRRQFAITKNETSGFHTEVLCDRFSHTAIQHNYLHDYLQRNQDEIGKLFFVLCHSNDIRQPLKNSDIQIQTVTEHSLRPVYIKTEDITEMEKGTELSQLDIKTDLPEPFDIQQCFPYQSDLIFLKKGEQVHGIFEPMQGNGYLSSRFQPIVISHYSYTSHSNPDIIEDADEHIDGVIGIEENGIMDYKEVIQRCVLSMERTLMLALDEWTKFPQSPWIQREPSEVSDMWMFRIGFSPDIPIGDHTLAELMNTQMTQDVRTLILELDETDSIKQELFQSCLVNAHREHPLDLNILLKIKLGKVGSYSLLDLLLIKYTGMLQGRLKDLTMEQKFINYLRYVTEQILDQVKQFEMNLERIL